MGYVDRYKVGVSLGKWKKCRECCVIEDACEAEGGDIQNSGNVMRQMCIVERRRKETGGE